ncbi:hypothetical protein GGR53DRAFT_462281 [Hypoxylon sp. FL1150]|nr:hypothetical protein GGR53DRAFT_462281 [Hypoxylon sp. FL1150]
MASIRDLLSSSQQDSPAEPAPEGTRSPTGKSGTVSETTHFVIEFILDIVCPYCYVTLKNLDAAITLYKARHPEAVVEVVCTPFFLDPLAVRSAYNKSTYIQGRDLHPRDHKNEHLFDLAKAAGIDFAWEGITGNTRDAHKLLRFALEPAPTTVRSTAFVAGGATSHPETNTSATARGPALQLRLLATLFAAHHTGDADVSDPLFLCVLGAAVLGDLFPSSVESPRPADVLRTRVLENPAWGAAVDALVADARRGRSVPIGAVPTLVVNDRYVIGGAQDAEFLVGELEKIRVGGGRGAEAGQSHGQE